ncbi:PREDICTED: proline-rich protein 2-like [Cyprinodon variegatus]|uniref:proline-rich protein 2-like n=1 Tax=Cyprinodon variegatus TaxID=28743 RepID=UPI000742623B|nr:PREDICTED: proline-rich protein 2-like [Cyprinodon variegatus]
MTVVIAAMKLYRSVLAHYIHRRALRTPVSREWPHQSHHHSPRARGRQQEPPASQAQDPRHPGTPEATAAGVDNRAHTGPDPKQHPPQNPGPPLGATRPRDPRPPDPSRTHPAEATSPPNGNPTDSAPPARGGPSGPTETTPEGRYGRTDSTNRAPGRNPPPKNTTKPLHPGNLRAAKPPQLHTRSRYKQQKGSNRRDPAAPAAKAARPTPLRPRTAHGLPRGGRPPPATTKHQATLHSQTPCMMHGAPPAPAPTKRSHTTDPGGIPKGLPEAHNQPTTDTHEPRPQARPPLHPPDATTPGATANHQNPPPKVEARPDALQNRSPPAGTTEEPMPGAQPHPAAAQLPGQ